MARTFEKFLKIRNNKAVKAVNAAGSAEIELFKLDASDILQLLGTVQYSGYEIANKNYVDTGLSAKEPTIAAGTSSQFWRGDKSWQTLDTAAVAEHSSALYFTDARAKTAAVVDSLAGSQTDQAPSVSAVKSALSAKLDASEKGAASGLAPLNASSKIDATYLPSYVDDVVEYANLAAFPAEGEAGKIYVALDSGKIYRWSGSAYIEISPSEVNSVNGQTGIVVLDTDDVSEGSSNLYFTSSRAKSAAVVNSTAGSETDQAASVSAMKSYVSGQISGAAVVQTHEVIELDAADITAGYVDLAVEAVANSVMVVPVGGPVQEPGVDFTLSVESSKTRVTFAGDLEDLLEAGDKLVVYYSH